MTAPTVPTTTTTAAALPRGTAVYVARCARRACPTQVRMTLPTRSGRPVMATPLGLAWLPLMPLGDKVRTAAPGTQDAARLAGLLALGLVCNTHDTSLWLREASGVLRPDTACDARCWRARHRVCACSCAGRMHGSALDTRPALSG